MIDYIDLHKEIVADRDYKRNLFRVRVDYMSHGDKIDFFIAENKEFTLSKKLLRRDKTHLFYEISIQNTGSSPIKNLLALYSTENGTFQQQGLFKSSNESELIIDKINPGKTVKVMFIVPKLSNRTKALELIRKIPKGVVFGNKVVGIFERFDDDLRKDVI